jgi:hypothetical protein
MFITDYDDGAHPIPRHCLTCPSTVLWTLSGHGVGLSSAGLSARLAAVHSATSLTGANRTTNRLLDMRQSAHRNKTKTEKQGGMMAVVVRGDSQKNRFC